MFTLPENIYAQKERSEIEEKYKWDLCHIYSSDDEWRNNLKRSTKNSILFISRVHFQTHPIHYSNIFRIDGVF
jgi:oligoendopeptidase F